MKKVTLSSALAIISFAAIGMEQQKSDIQIGKKELLAKYANTDHEFNNYFPTWFGSDLFARKVVNYNGKHVQTYAEAIHLPNCDHYAIDLKPMIDEYSKLDKSDNTAFTKLLLNSLRSNMPKFTNAINSLYPSQKSEKFKLLVTEFNNTINIYSDSAIDKLRDNEMSAIAVFALSARDALIECAQLLDNRYFSDSLFPIKELSLLSEDSRNAFLTRTQDCMDQINTSIENLKKAINETKEPKIDYSKTRIGDIEAEEIELPESAQYIADIRPIAKQKLADFIDLYQELLIIQQKVKTKDAKFNKSSAEDKVNFAMSALNFGDRVAYIADISRRIKAFQYTLKNELSFLCNGTGTTFRYEYAPMLKYPIIRCTSTETAFPR